MHKWIGERARYQRVVKAEAKPQTQERCALCIFKTTAHKSTKAASDTEHQVVVFDCTLSSRAEPLHNPERGGRKSRPNRTPFQRSSAAAQLIYGLSGGASSVLTTNFSKKIESRAAWLLQNRKQDPSKVASALPNPWDPPPGGRPKPPNLPRTPLGVPSSRRLPSTGRHSASRWIESLFAVTFFLWQHNH